MPPVRFPIRSFRFAAHLPAALALLALALPARAGMNLSLAIAETADGRLKQPPGLAVSAVASEDMTTATVYLLFPRIGVEPEGARVLWSGFRPAGRVDRKEVPLPSIYSGNYEFVVEAVYEPKAGGETRISKRMREERRLYVKVSPAEVLASALSFDDLERDAIRADIEARGYDPERIDNWSSEAPTLARRWRALQTASAAAAAPRARRGTRPAAPSLKRFSRSGGSRRDVKKIGIP